MIDFGDFYFAVHERKLFPWQERLARKIATEGWPEDEVIKLPTASGKTSLVDIAVFALAAQADRPIGERSAPLRTFFVVDRRLVVDDVTLHARRLQRKLDQEQSGAIGEIRQKLLIFGSDRPLKVATLRGGMYRSNTWADLPNQPLICVSTVDQIGSRLLFRGYGVGQKRRSVDAGLVGCDSLIILDEAHLSGAFLETVRAVRKYASWAERRPASARLIEMSATAKNKASFELNEEDYAEERLARRLNAPKRTELREVANLEREAASEAQRLAAKPQVNAVGIVLNTVNAARAVFEQLKNICGEDQAVLLTGRVRPHDRDELLNKFLGRIKAGRTRSESECLFVVATQTIEVGADLDFDALVSEAAPLDALRQRFGRLNRLGELDSAEAVILRRKLARGERDRVYGEPVQRTWEWLTAGGRNAIDFGARQMQGLYEASGDVNLNSVSQVAPVMTPSHIETWIQTYPTPDPDPEIAPFLHGRDALSADVNLVWRADLEDEPVSLWNEFLEISSPTTTEALPVPIWTAKAWLMKGDLCGPSDLEGAEEPNEPDNLPQASQGRPFYIWRGPDESREGQIDSIRPGDTLVLRSSEGGADKYGWNPASRFVTDIGDECANKRARQAGGHYVVRLNAMVLFPDDAARREALIEDTRLYEEDGDEEAQKRILDRVCERASCPKREDWKERSTRKGSLYFVTRWMKPKPESDENGAEISVEETDEDDSASLTVPVTLDKHVNGVVEHVRKFAGSCGIPLEVREALIRAAELHDLGKCDERFQTMLDPLGEGPSELLAKGGGEPSKPERERRRRLAEYPQTARHEFWSVALAEKGADFPSSEFRDLVLYLIGTHHGHGRPFAPIWDEDPEFVVDCNGAGLKATGKDVQALGWLGSGWVDRFWRLNRTYGHWGLAYLEAILRRADCVQSREEQENSNEHD